MDKAFKVVPKFEKIFSTYNPQSEISTINQQADQHSVKISHMMKQALKRSRKISQMTNGAYDITYNSPAPITYQDIVLKGNRLHFLKAGTKLGMFSIAKGLIIDSMSQSLKQDGFRHFIVNAGGDLYASGSWEVSVRHSNKKFKINNMAVASCGTTERGFHIFDPRTKRQARRDYLSVTVIARKAWLANTLATANFVSGPRTNESIKIFQHNPIAAFFAY